MRLAGWGLIVVYYATALLNEALNSTPLRIGGLVVALVGVVLVAWGFERKFHNEQKRKAAKRQESEG